MSKIRLFKYFIQNINALISLNDKNELLEIVGSIKSLRGGIVHGEEVTNNKFKKALVNLFKILPLSMGQEVKNIVDIVFKNNADYQDDYNEIINKINIVEKQIEKHRIKTSQDITEFKKENIKKQRKIIN